MTITYGGDGSDKGDRPKKPVGYKSPPVHGQIQPGEKRNPFGANGRKAHEEDAFEKVRRCKARVNIEGKTSNVMSDEAYWLKLMNMALAGNMAAARIIAKELGARRPLGPAPLTAEELAQEAADLAEREILSASIFDALERMAADKRDGDGEPACVRYGPDGRPIVEPPADDGIRESSHDD